MFTTKLLKVLLNVIGSQFMFLLCLELTNRTPTDNTPVHVINFDIQDNHEEATIGAFLMLDLTNMMVHSDDLDNDIDELLQEFETKTNRRLLHTIAFQ